MTELTASGRRKTSDSVRQIYRAQPFNALPDTVITLEEINYAKSWFDVWLKMEDRKLQGSLEEYILEGRKEEFWQENVEEYARLLKASNKRKKTASRQKSISLN
jgi:hypothetical protein